MTEQSEQSELVDRLRSAMADEPSVREVRMFGGRAFMVHEKLVLSAQKDGSLLARIAAERHAELSEVPGASQAVMGTDRVMGPGWLTVASESIVTDEQLAFWVGACMEHNKATRTDGPPGLAP